MPKQKTVRRVQAYDLTTPEGREDYENLVEDANVKVTKEMEFPMGGTGAVVRVIDYKESTPDSESFPYEKPIS